MTIQKVSRISIYDRSGIYIAEIDANFRRTWTLSGEDTGEFEISKEDAKAMHDYLRFGNLIYVEHNKLPSWGGVIDPPRTWTHNSIKVTAYSGEHLLKFAHLDKTVKITASPGTTISSLLGYMNINTRIIPRNISGDGAELKSEFHYDSVYDAIAEICELGDFEYVVAPGTINNKLVFYIDVMPRYGIGNYSNIKLLEGKNLSLSDEPIIEEGPIQNVITGYGSGSTWTNKKISTATDSESIAEYGHRYATTSIDQDTVVNVEKGTTSYLTEYSTPRQVFDLNIIDVDGTYEDVGLGNRYDIEFYTVGFSGNELGLSTTARIIGMTYEDNEAELLTVMEAYDGAN